MDEWNLYNQCFTKVFYEFDQISSYDNFCVGEEHRQPYALYAN
jgi:hypothetical protein